MRIFFLSLLIGLLYSCSNESVSWEDHPDVEIIRDQWGVPHIYGKTDTDVAYGLAWAQCEDDFVTIQEQMLAVKGMYAEVKGKDGAIVDFGIQFMGLREIVNEKYETDISEEFKKVLRGYAEGVNEYAKLNPGKVLLKKLFPLHPEDIIIGYMMGVAQMTGAFSDLSTILEEKVTDRMEGERGSNAIAISQKKTNDGYTYLAINSHQPLEGWYSWYEAHLVSEEGMNILGGTFPGGVTIFHGVNEYLGWAHTVNHADFSDVYRLTMHPSNKDQYYFDGQWLPLEKVKYKTKVKIWGALKFPVSRTIYRSVYGPTFKTSEGTFAWRLVAGQKIHAPEQWYRMNKSRNFNEFYRALEMRGIPCTNIVYADRSDTLFFISYGTMPVRNPGYKWSEVLPGDTSATFWNSDLIPLDSLPQIKNPVSGIIFNTNNTPFNASLSTDNPVETELNKVMGYQNTGLDNNRSRRLLELLQKKDTLSYSEFKNIKYDQTYPSTMISPNMINLESLFHLREEDHPKIAQPITLLKGWNRNTGKQDTVAPLFIETYKALNRGLSEKNRLVRGGKINDMDAAVAIFKADSTMRSKYGRNTIALGEIQKHIRGDVNLPMGGGPDVLAAIHAVPYQNNIYKTQAGESYIMMVRMNKESMIVESVNAYGSSTEPESPHFTDQMKLYVNQELKPMKLQPLNKNEILKKYRPLKMVR